MDKERKEARDFLKICNIEEFNILIEKIKITPRQKDVARRIFVNGEDEITVSLEMNIHVSTVRRDLITVYNKCVREIEYKHEHSEPCKQVII